MPLFFYITMTSFEYKDEIIEICALDGMTLEDANIGLKYAFNLPDDCKVILNEEEVTDLSQIIEPDDEIRFANTWNFRGIMVISLMSLFYILLGDNRMKITTRIINAYRRGNKDAETLLRKALTHSPTRMIGVNNFLIMLHKEKICITELAPTNDAMEWLSSVSDI